MKYLRIHNVSIHIISFYQNGFINECVRKTFLKFPQRQTERRKVGAILWDVEELRFLKNEEILLTLHYPNVLQKKYN